MNVGFRLRQGEFCAPEGSDVDLLSEALKWRRLGIAVVPVHYRDKRPTVRWQEWQTKLPSEDRLRTWFRPSMPRNAAIVCGHQGLTVLDFDDTRSYLEWCGWARRESPAAFATSQTYTVVTRRGFHVYLYCDDTPRCHKLRYVDEDGEVHEWGEIKGKGGYVIAAGSVHPTGHVYRARHAAAEVVRVTSLDGIVPEPPVKADLDAVFPTTLRVFPTSSLMPMSLIEEIRERLDILSLIGDARPSGRYWYMAHCPFHQDEHESFWINTEKGICGCYAGCMDKALDVIGLYARLHNLSNREAIRELGAKVRVS